MHTRIVNGEKVIEYSFAELRAFVDSVLNHGRQVNAWEQSFMKDMQKKQSYSEKEARLIERIYTERT